MTDAPANPAPTSTSQAAARDVVALLRARNPLLWIASREEGRVESYLLEAAAAAGYTPWTWDVAQGVADLAGNVQTAIGGPDPVDIFNTIRDRAKQGATRDLWILRDLTPWVSPPIGMTTCRALRNLARALPQTPRNSAQAVIVLSPSSDIPPELANHVTLLEWPMPDRSEITRILDSAVDGLPDEIKAGALLNGSRDQAIDAAIGLSGEEAAACFARSLVQLRKIDPATVAREKRRVIARERVLEWHDPIPGGLDAVGGLDCLKTWLTTRRAAYTPQARAYGLPAPRGALLVGVPGCGKSLTAKAIATAWQVPLLRLDLGALKGKFVGESEGNLRRALRTIEAIGRCVVWLDEVEKALAGATQGAADGGVSSDALGTILSWMQERPGDAFVVATANDVSALPPELLRKGRFDEIWFVDLPTSRERADIASTALAAHGRAWYDPGPGVYLNVEAVADVTEGFTGAEIAALVPDALFAAYADNAREITTDDLLAAARTTVPLAKTMPEKITTLRAWATGRARPATTPETASAQSATARVRQLDF